MTIRPIDIQTSIVGSQSVSEARSQQQGLEQLHQMNPNGEIEEIERKAKEEVKESEADESNNEPTEASSNKKVISDGIRGRKLDFRA